VGQLLTRVGVGQFLKRLQLDPFPPQKLLLSPQFGFLNVGPQPDSGHRISASFNAANDCTRPRLCENPNLKTQYGESKPIHGFSIKHVGFMNTVQWCSRPFIYRHPNINECNKQTYPWFLLAKTNSRPITWITDLTMSRKEQCYHRKCVG
jgi:hypothetical protein